MPVENQANSMKNKLIFEKAIIGDLKDILKLNFDLFKKETKNTITV